MQVAIFQPVKNAMQSASQKHNIWKIRFPRSDSKFIETIMNWTSSNSTINQINLSFSSLEQAINFAKKNNWEFEVIEPNIKKLKKKSYADNFK